MRGLALVTAALSLACTVADPLPGYVPADGVQRAAVLRALDDYYGRRSRAAVTGETGELFAAFPKLAQGELRASGVNVDEFFVRRMRALDVREVTSDPQGIEPVRVYLRDDRAVAFVHGRETWLLPRGDKTISDFYTRFDLRLSETGWSIERTDEAVFGERPPVTPR